MKNLIGKLPDCPLKLDLWSSDSWKIVQSLEIQTEAAVQMSWHIAYRSASRCIYSDCPYLDTYDSNSFVFVCPLCTLVNISDAFCHQQFLKKNSFRNTIRMSNSLGPVQHFINNKPSKMEHGPLERLSTLQVKLTAIHMKNIFRNWNAAEYHFKDIFVCLYISVSHGIGLEKGRTQPCKLKSYFYGMSLWSFVSLHNYFYLLSIAPLSTYTI